MHQYMGGGNSICAPVISCGAQDDLDLEEGSAHIASVLVNSRTMCFQANERWKPLVQAGRCNSRAEHFDRYSRVEVLLRLPQVHGEGET